MPKFFITLLMLILLVIAAGYLYLTPSSQEQEYVLMGTILTMEADQPETNAVWVKNGVIQAVGQPAIVAAETKSLPIISLGEQVLTPGLIEPHTHPVAAALLGATVDVSAFTHNSRSEIMTTLKEAANGFALTPWLISFGWDPVAIDDLDSPTLEELDALSSDRPIVILTQMMHEAYLNSAAFKAAGVKIIDKEDHTEGFIRDQKGKLTGTVREVAAISKIVSAAPSAPENASELLLRLQYKKYAKAGYTTIGVTGAVGRLTDPVASLRKISREDISPLRTFVYLLPNQVEAHPLGGDDRFKVLGLKLWLDGSPFTGGAAFEDGYHDSELTKHRLGIPHTHRGDLNYTLNDLRKIIPSYHAKGYQIALHVQGERAIEEALTIFEEVQKTAPTPGLRHRLEHNALITADQLDRAKALNMSTGFFVDHVYFYGDALPHLIGPERTARYMPVKTALEKNIAVSLHGDHPATPVNAIRVMKTATQRLSKSGKTLTAADQAITAEQALFAMTIGGAMQLGQQEKIGSIKKGKLADFTLFNKSPLLSLKNKSDDLLVVKTWKAGQETDVHALTWEHIKLGLSALKEILAE
ncbi:MAG: amidohydrolase [Sneathiella sp.]|nr:amidohydrolase [Sneathiella sp.]